METGHLELFSEKLLLKVKVKEAGRLIFPS